MAKKVGLTVYGISVQDNENQRRNLNKLISSKSINEIIKEFVDSNKKSYSKDISQETVFTFEEIESETITNNENKECFTILYGKVRTGEYGIESELVDINTGDTYSRTVNQADTMPFGFCIAIPAGDVNSGIIVLQSIGNYSMKVALNKKLSECLKIQDQLLRLELGVIVPKTYIDRFFEYGVLQKIRMIRYDIPQDISDRIGINYGVKQTVEERIISKPLGFMERKRRALDEWKRGQRSYTEVIEIDDFKYDDLKLEFKLGRTNKTISLKNTDKLLVTEDITEIVDQQGGHPVFESLVPVMKETAKEYLIGKGLIEEE